MSEIELEEPDYKQPSALAIASLVAGLVAPLALLDFTAWGLPVVSVVMALFALRSIQTSGGRLFGTSLALTGLFLGVLFMVAAPAYVQFTNQRLVSQARHFAEIYLDQIRSGKTREAFLLTLEPAFRHEDVSNLDHYFGTNPTKATDLAFFEGTAPVTFAKSTGPTGILEFKQALDCRVGSANCQVTLMYQLGPPGSAEHQQRVLLLYMRRNPNFTDLLGRWKIERTEMRAHALKSEF